MNRVNIHIIPSGIVNASRLVKEVESIKEAGLTEKCILLGLWQKKLPEYEELDQRTTVIRIKLIKDYFETSHILWKFLIFLSVIEYRFKLLNFLKKSKPYLVNCHQIILLPVCSYCKILYNYKLVYDAHELETEVAGLSGIKKIYLKWSERVFIRYADKVVVVSDKIAEWYRKSYKIDNVYVVRNVPYLRRKKQGKTNLLREEFSIPDNKILFIYNGFLTIGRGIELILEAFSKCGIDHHVVFMGYGPKVELTKEYERLYRNIHYKVAVTPEEVIKYTAGADVGLAIIENSSLSYYYSLSNKFFEYIQAGLPVIVSDFPEMGSIVDKYDCGWKVNPDAETLTVCIKKINVAAIDERRRWIEEAQNDLCWEKESLVYDKIFKTQFQKKIK